MLKNYWLAGAILIILLVALGIWQNQQSNRELIEGTKPSMENKPNGQQVDTSGLKINDLELGNGGTAEPGRKLTVHYTGFFEDGSKFDSSYDYDQPFQFVLGDGLVIAGWELGLLGMKEGGRRELTIPPQLAYGANGYGPIPSNATLRFEIELIAVE